MLSLDRIIFYSNGYIAFYNDVDWNFSIQNLMKTLDCKQSKFPEIFIALVALELILIIKKLHECGIIHANISIENVILSSM